MSDASQKKKNVIGITIGDINGIGPEVIIKALEDSRIIKQFTPIIYGSSKVISFYKKALDKENFIFQQIQSADKAHHKKVNVLNVWEDVVEIKPGQANETGGKCARQALEKATEDLKSGIIHGITTAPLSKELVQSDNFKFPGHTEFLTQQAEAKDSLMFLVHEDLRVGVVTGHIPLKEVSTVITQEKITSKLKIMIKSLKQDFGIKKPRVAVLGMNPHAGEKGLLGEEEQKVIEPVIKQFTNEHHLVFGPFPADGFFGMSSYRNFDGILAMYHDQGLIPFKTLAFDSGVNYTAGLSFVRTSPDHGTAFAIAGKNEADPTSLRNALYLANDVVDMRKDNGSEKPEEQA